MPKQFSADGFDAHCDHVLEKSHHAQEVKKIIPKLKSLLLRYSDKKDGFSRIEGIDFKDKNELEGKGLSVWFYLEGRRFCLSYDHEHRCINLRSDTNRGEIEFSWDDSDISRIDGDFRSLVRLCKVA